MSTFLTDLRYAVRMLLKAPGFTIIAIFALALGIGANTAIFSVVNAVLLRPLPYPEPDRLVVLRETTLQFPSGSVSYPNYLDWRAGQHTFTDLALVRRESFNLSLPGGQMAPERVGGGRVSWNFLAVLGMKPLLGRDFSEAEDVPGAAPVVMIGERCWRTRFGGSRGVLGQQVMLDGVAREIIGVLPDAVRYPRLAEIWVPLAEVKKDQGVLSRGNHPGFSALGRLKPGVTLAKAKADLDTIAVALEKQYPDSNTGRRLEMQFMLESAVGHYRQSLGLLLGAVGCVLLIACANVANLQLARALARGKELAIRAALGASRWRLARQLLTESTLLAVFGGAAGVILAIWSLDGILALSPANVARFKETRIDPSALAFTALVALGAGILAGIWPAWKISRTAALSVVLHEVGTRGGSGSASRQRARSALVITQVALAVILLAGAGLTLKSFWRAQQEPLGFDPHGVLTMNISLPEARYDKDEKINAFFTRLLERVTALPGVECAAIGSNIPFDDNEWDSSFHITGTPDDPPGQEPSVEVNVVSPDYFRVVGMPIIRGRTFGAAETPGIPRSIIVDQSFAQRYLAGKDPIGAHVDDNQSREEKPPPVTVIGVVPRTRNEAPGEDNVEKLNFSQMYFPTAQYAQSGVMLLVRAKSGDPMALAPAITREVQAIDPDQPVGQVATMEKNIANSLAARRLTMTLLAAFAGLALVLASVGLYGVMALSVTQRTRELGIRLALGAARADVFRLVLGQGLALVSLGLGLGLLGALAAGRALASLLYNVGAIDLAALGTALLSLAIVALLACFFPARRATQVDPMVALREE